jgi:ATP-binding cassette subfamily B protein
MAAMTGNPQGAAAAPATAPPPETGLVGLIAEFVRPHRRDVALTVLFQAVQTLAMLYLPTLNADIVDHGVVAGDTGHVLQVGALMVGVTFVQAGAAAAAVYFGARTAMALGRDLRSAIFHSVQDFSAREIDRFGAPSLITRTTNDVQQIQTLMVLTLTMLLAAPIMGIGGLALALGQDVPLSATLLAAIPVTVAAMALIIRAMIPSARAMQERIDGVNTVMREHITGIRVIRAFVRDAFERARFDAANGDLRTVSLRVGRIQAFFGATAMLVSNLTSIAVVWFGTVRIADGSMQVGALIAYLSYVGHILMAVMMSMGVFMLAPRAKVAAGRIREVLGTAPSVPPPANPVTELPGRGLLDVEHVSFRYDGAEAPALHDVSLIARPGETTAIIGATGAGKTTLINLIPRMFDVDEGAVRIDGVDVRELDRQVIARTVGVVPQRAYLFSGTVASNLRYGNPDATDAELWRALETAQAADFVRAMPDGLATPIGQGGTTVSGGQRQRLAIARTLVARPRIYLFDDAFSALDTATDAALREALRSGAADAAQVIVAQRVATIRDADRIVVLDAGRVVAVGAHDELLGTDPVYTEIVNSQLTLQEAL